MTLLHTFLDVVGMVPGIPGLIANAANAVIYGIEGDWINAAISGAEAIFGIFAGSTSILGKAAKTGKFGKIAITGRKAIKTFDYTTKIMQVVSCSLHLYQNAGTFGRTAITMVDRYIVRGEKFSGETLLEVATLGLSAFGMHSSAKGLKAGMVDLLGNTPLGKINIDLSGIKNGAKTALSSVKNGVRKIAADIRRKGGGYKTSYWKSSGNFTEGSNGSVSGNLSFEEALQNLEDSGLSPGQTVISKCRVMEIVENYNPLKATSSVYSDATGRYLVEGHHTTVAATILGKGSALNMNIPTNQIPSATNIHWTKKWWEVGKKAIRVID